MVRCKSDYFNLISFNLIRKGDDMTREDLMNNSEWNLSEYDDREYYMKQGCHNIGDTAYVYVKETNIVNELQIVHAILRSDDISAYESFDDDVLLDGEDEYKADCSCEVITDDDSYLLWFIYKNCI